MNDSSGGSDNDSLSDSHDTENSLGDFVDGPVSDPDGLDEWCPADSESSSESSSDDAEAASSSSIEEISRESNVNQVISYDWVDGVRRSRRQRRVVDRYVDPDFVHVYSEGRPEDLWLLLTTTDESEEDA